MACLQIYDTKPSMTQSYFVIAIYEASRIIWPAMRYRIGHFRDDAMKFGPIPGDVIIYASYPTHSNFSQRGC